MEGHELLVKMTKVRAPADFEAGVLARLPAARASRSRARRARFSYAFAGSAALVLAGFLLFSPSTGPEREDAVLTLAEQRALSAGSEKGGAFPVSDRNRALPVYERMNYESELRDAQPQPRTVYILEQVSEVPSSEIIY